MKTLYLNGLSKVTLALYGAGIIFGPPAIAQFVSDSVAQSSHSEALTRIIWGAGTVCIFCVSPFVLTVVTRRWREVILGIVTK